MFTTHSRIAAAFSLCLLCGAGSVFGADVSTRPASSNGLLTSEEVHVLIDAGQYADALRALSHIVLLTGPAAAPYNRHEMLMLKAECQLQLKQYPAAIGTTETARKESTIAHKPDEAMEAASFEHLMQSSPNGAYVPKTASVKLPIKLADKEKRKGAYDALYADEKEAFNLKATAANKGTSLPPFVEAMKLTAMLRVSEYGSTGTTTKTDGAVKDLADHAAKLVDATLEDLNTKTDKIAEEANRVVTEPSTVTDHAGHSYESQISHRQGLTGTDAQDLREMDGTLKKIPPAMLDLIHLFPDQADPFKKCASKSLDISKKVQKTLNADYTSM